MLPRHSCHIYEILRCKEVGGRFKVIIWGGMLCSLYYCYFTCFVSVEIGKAKSEI